MGIARKLATIPLFTSQVNVFDGEADAPILLECFCAKLSLRHKASDRFCICQPEPYNLFDFCREVVAPDFSICCLDIGSGSAPPPTVMKEAAQAVARAGAGDRKAAGRKELYGKLPAGKEVAGWLHDTMLLEVDAMSAADALEFFDAYAPGGLKALGGTAAEEYGMINVAVEFGGDLWYL